MSINIYIYFANKYIYIRYIYIYTDTQIYRYTSYHHLFHKKCLSFPNQERVLGDQYWTKMELANFVASRHVSHVGCWAAIKCHVSLLRQRHSIQRKKERKHFFSQQLLKLWKHKVLSCYINDLFEKLMTSHPSDGFLWSVHQPTKPLQAPASELCCIATHCGAVKFCRKRPEAFWSWSLVFQRMESLLEKQVTGILA